MTSPRRNRAGRNKRRSMLYRYFSVSALLFYYFVLQAPLYLFYDIGRRTKAEYNLIPLSPAALEGGRGISLNNTKTGNQSSSNDHSQDQLVDCGCPDTCTKTALSDKKNELKYSCGNRIEYLLSKHQIPQQAQACRIAANEKIPACGPECDPDLCWPKFLEGDQQNTVKELNNTVTVHRACRSIQSHGDCSCTQRREPCRGTVDRTRVLDGRA